MKLGHAVAAGVLLAPILVVGATEPSVAANTHTVIFVGYVGAFDHGIIERSKAFNNFNQRINLTHDAPKQTFHASVCAGGETVADLTVELFLRSDEKIVAGSNIKLYEFQDCNHSDLEKSYSPAPVIIAMGKTKKFDIGAASNEETFDAANAEFTATHIKSAADLGRPNEPSNVIASTRNISLICAATGKPCPGKNVGVEWQDNATNETGYEIRNTTTNQSFLFAPDTTHFTFTNLERITHCFQVRAVGAAGPSDWTPVGERKECV